MRSKGAAILMISIILGLVVITAGMIVLANALSRVSKRTNLVLEEYDVMITTNTYVLAEKSFMTSANLSAKESIMQTALTGVGKKYWYDYGKVFKPDMQDVEKNLTIYAWKYLNESSFGGELPKLFFIRFSVNYTKPKMNICEFCDFVNMTIRPHMKVSGLYTTVENYPEWNLSIYSHLPAMVKFGNYIIDYISTANMKNGVEKTIREIEKDRFKINAFNSNDWKKISKNISVSVSFDEGPEFESMWDGKKQNNLYVSYDARISITEKRPEYYYFVFDYNTTHPIPLGSGIKCSKDVKTSSDLPNYLSKCKPYFNLFKKYWKKNGLEGKMDLLFVLSLVKQESGCNPNPSNCQGIMQVVSCSSGNPCVSVCTLEENINRGTKKLSQDYDRIKNLGVNPSDIPTLLLFSYNRGFGTTTLAVNYMKSGMDIYEAMKKACYEMYDQGAYGNCGGFNKEDCCNAPGLGARYPEKIFGHYEKACTEIGGVVERTGSFIDVIPNDKENVTHVYIEKRPVELIFNARDRVLIDDCSSNHLLTIEDKDDALCYDGQLWTCVTDVNGIHDEDDGNLITNYANDHLKSLSVKSGTIYVDGRIPASLTNLINTNPSNIIYTDIDGRVGSYACAMNVSSGEHRFCKYGENYDNDPFCCIATGRIYIASPKPSCI